MTDIKKTNVVYSLVESSVQVEEQTVTSYGVACSRNGRLMKKIEDISTDKQLIADLVQQLNQYELDPVQLDDIVEDALI